MTNMDYEVICINCHEKYISHANRNGNCPACKALRAKENAKKKQKAYDPLIVYLKKGKKEHLKTFSGLCHMSVNQFIITALLSYSKELYDEKASSTDPEYLKELKTALDNLQNK